MSEEALWRDEGTRREVDFGRVGGKSYRALVRHAVGERAADAVLEGIRRMLRHRSGTPYEDLYVHDMRDGLLVGSVVNAQAPKRVEFTEELARATSAAVDDGAKIVIVHNHPDSFPPSAADIRSLIANRAWAASSPATTGACTSSRWSAIPCPGIVLMMQQFGCSRSCVAGTSLIC